jgi:hypothetical protein
VNSHLDVIIEEFLGLELLLAVRALEVPDPLVEILKHSFTYTLAATSLDRKHSSKPTGKLNNAKRGPSLRYLAPGFLHK